MHMENLQFNFMQVWKNLSIVFKVNLKEAAQVRKIQSGLARQIGGHTKIRGSILAPEKKRGKVSTFGWREVLLDGSVHGVGQPAKTPTRQGCSGGI
jgi:hypothetical protein